MASLRANARYPLTSFYEVEVATVTARRPWPVTLYQWLMQGHRSFHAHRGRVGYQLPDIQQPPPSSSR